MNDIIKDFEKCIKCIKIADRSAGGWDTVTEYLGDDLADNSSDECNLRRAEKRAMEKLELAKKNKDKKSQLTSVRLLRFDRSVPISMDRDAKGSGRPDRRFPDTSSSTTKGRCFRCNGYGHYRHDCYASSRAPSPNKDQSSLKVRYSLCSSLSSLHSSFEGRLLYPLSLRTHKYVFPQ